VSKQVNHTERNSGIRNLANSNVNELVFKMLDYKYVNDKKNLTGGEPIKPNIVVRIKWLKITRNMYGYWSPREVGVFTGVAPKLVLKWACQINPKALPELLWLGLFHGRQTGACAAHMAGFSPKNHKSTPQSSSNYCN